MARIVARVGGVRGVLDLVTSLALIAAAMAVLWSVWEHRAQDVEAAPGSGRARVESASAAENIEAEGLTVQLSPGEFRGAPVALVEFSDFECPFCARHARETLPALRRDFVDTGKVSYVFRHFPLSIHPGAPQAAAMASCAAEQGRFWEMHALLFQAPGKLGRAALIDRAEKFGLDRSAVASCLGRIGARVGEHQAEGRRLGITATPTFLFGNLDASGTLRVRRRLNGAFGYATFKSAIEAVMTPRS